MNQAGIIEAGMIGLAAVIRDIDWIFQRCPKGLGWLVSDGQAPETLIRLCHNQAHAFTCLFYGGQKNEKSDMKDIRNKRLAMVKNACSGVDASEIINKAARNALAHFDERYVQILQKNGPGVWFQDVMIGSVGLMFSGIVNRDHFIRVYVHEERSMYIFGETLQLDKLRQQAEEVLGCLLLERARRRGMWVDP